MWWQVILNIYTFLSTCKLCTISLFRCFLSNLILFWWISVIYFCATLLWLFTFLRPFGILCIDILTSASTAKFFSITNFSHVMFFYPSRGIHWCFLRRLFEFLEHPFITSISKKKKSFSDNFGKLPSKTFILESFIQEHLQNFLVCERPVALKSSRPF